MLTKKMNPLHRKLDRSRAIYERKFRGLVAIFLNRVTKIVIKALTEKLVKAKKIDPVDWGSVEDMGKKYFKPYIFEAFVQGTKNAYGAVGLSGSFDVYSTEVVGLVEDICSDLVTNITDETRKAVNRVIAADIEEGLGYKDMIKDLRSIVGLTDRQAKSVKDFETWLKREYPESSISNLNSKISQYKNKLLNDRLNMISRTETARAQNYGFVEAMSTMGVDQFEFSAAPDACELYCLPLDKKIIDASEADSLIPVHPNCRCVLLPVIGHKIIETPMKNFPESLEEPV